MNNIKMPVVYIELIISKEGMNIKKIEKEIYKEAEEIISIFTVLKTNKDTTNINNSEKNNFISDIRELKNWLMMA